MCCLCETISHENPCTGNKDEPAESVRVVCPECGTYDITRNAAALLKNYGRNHREQAVFRLKDSVADYIKAYSAHTGRTPLVTCDTLKSCGMR